MSSNFNSNRLKALLLFALLLMGALAISTTGCEVGPQFEASHTSSSTITLGAQRVVLINSAISTVIQGGRRNDVVVVLDAKVIARTSTLAKEFADALEVVEDTSDPTTLSLTLARVEQATLSGTLTIKVPSDIQVAAIQRGGTLDVIDVRDNIEINAISHVRVLGAERNVSIAIEQGNALIETLASPGTQLGISLGAGSIELTVPRGLSADVEAVLRGPGVIIPNHPQLPPWAGGDLPYRANVNGGLAVFRLSTGSGNIVIRTP